MMSKRKNFIVAVIVLSALLVPGATLAGSMEEPVTTQEEADKAFTRVRELMTPLGVTVNRNILLLLRPRNEVQVHFVSGGGRSIVVGGFYRPFAPESIWVIKGRPKLLIMGDMAHELAHAWQSTNSPLQDRKIKEGFAMWCQYKVLTALGRPDVARQYAEMKDPDYGGGLRMFLAIEKKDGIAGVMKFARTAKSVPEEYSNN